MPTPSYCPSEAAIADAIERRIGSPGFFQRVAEQIARGLYPNLSTVLVPFGRRPDDKTVTGWPDAFLTKSDGSIIAIEATTARDARTIHWPADLAALGEKLVPERRGGLVWVAWCDSLTPTTVSDMCDDAEKLGLPREDIHIVFRKELCARLRSPMHAPFWINDLGLKVTAGPFLRVQEVIDRVNFRRSTSIFPTAAEYEEGRVHAPAVLDEAETALAEQRSVMVVGHGAAGKTTLAMMMSYQPQYRHASTYYLDLTANSGDPTLTERAGEAIAAMADRGTLFVIDNAHLAPGLAVRLFEHWKSFGRASHFMLLTRRIRSRIESWDGDVELEKLPIPRLDLVATPADLEGVYRRLAYANGTPNPVPVPKSVLARWYRLFGGDLLAFSAAVLGLLEQGRGLEELDVADARSFVRKRYLAPAEFASETSALLDLAAVAEVEGMVEISAFAEDALTEYIAHGLVWVEARGFKGHHKSYRLAHPGMGTLLRDAANLSATSRDDRCRLLRTQPFLCVEAAMRTHANGETDEARALITALWAELTWPLADLRIGHWGSAVKIARLLEVADAQEISRRAVEWLQTPGTGAALLLNALSIPLSNLTTTLNFTKRSLPEVYSVLCEELTLPHNREALIRYLIRHIGNIDQFLIYCRDHLPELSRDVLRSLADEQALPHLIASARKCPLPGLIGFLRYAQNKLPLATEAIHADLARDLTELQTRLLSTSLGGMGLVLGYLRKAIPKTAQALQKQLERNPAELIERLSSEVTPLGDIPPFIESVCVNFPALRKMFWDELEKRPHGLIRRALAAPFDQLGFFLTRAHDMAPNLAAAMVVALTSEPLISAMADRCVQSGPEKAVALCKQEPALARIICAIDLAAWSQSLEGTILGQPSWFRRFATICDDLGRSDLSGIAARSIIRNARPEDFRPSATTLIQLVSILTAQHECEPDEVRTFFLNCLPPNWLAEQYRSSSVSLGAIALALHHIALDGRNWLAPHLFHPELLRRLGAEQPLHHDMLPAVGDWLQLLCAVRLLYPKAPLGMSLNGMETSEVVDFLPPGPADGSVQPMQAGLWAGLREWCYLTGRTTVVNHSLGTAMLAQFRAARPPVRPLVAAFNSAMIDWLERCEREDWRAVVERTPLFDALQIKLANSRPADPIAGEVTT